MIGRREELNQVQHIGDNAALILLQLHGKQKFVTITDPH